MNKLNAIQLIGLSLGLSAHYYKYSRQYSDKALHKAEDKPEVVEKSASDLERIAKAQAKRNRKMIAKLHKSQIANKAT